MTHKTPQYRRKNNRNTAVVTLTDSVTKIRQDYYLGQYNTAESREKYHKLIAEWEGAGRRLPKLDREPVTIDVTVSSLCLSYFQFVQDYYSKSETESIRVALRLFRKYHGSDPAESIGPKRMRVLREVMINNLDWSRPHLNAQIKRIKRMYKWGASRELISIESYHSINTLENLKRGRSKARETEKVGIADLGMVSQTIPMLNRQIAAMIEFQLATGCRPGEVVIMRPCDIDRTGDVWMYTPYTHKTQYLSKARVIYIGPKAQKVIIPFLNREEHEYMFSPIEADLEHRESRSRDRSTPLSCGNKPGSNRMDEPKTKPGEHYTTNSYGKAIKRACITLWPTPKGLSKADRSKWIKDHSWSPNMLRHTASTIVRAKHGLEAAQLLLGHSSAAITDAVYAERDQTKIMEIAKDVG